MNKRMQKFPYIEQFRSIIKQVRDYHSHRYLENDEGNTTREPITNPSFPTLKFSGSVKIHGTNAGIAIGKDGTYFAMSRSQIITPEKDNYGFASWAHSPEVMAYFKSIKNLNFPDAHSLTIYGEWFGKGIQKNVGVAQLERKWFSPFDSFVYETEDDELIDNRYWTQILPGHEEELGITPIRFTSPIYVSIDFNEPELSVNKLTELTEEVEKECPVAKYLGIENGIGEGIVWRCQLEDETVLRFKVKGEKHSSSKVKTLAAVDIEKIESIKEFVNYAVTESRLWQAAEETLDKFDENSFDFDKKKLGVFIKWVSSDVLKEESDTLEKNGLTMKDVGSDLSKKARTWFFDKEELSLYQTNYNR